MGDFHGVRIWIWSQTAGGQTAALPTSCCVTSVKSLCLSEPQPVHLQNGDSLCIRFSKAPVTDKLSPDQDVSLLFLRFRELTETCSSNCVPSPWLVCSESPPGASLPRNTLLWGKGSDWHPGLSSQILVCEQGNRKTPCIQTGLPTSQSRRPRWDPVATLQKACAQTV